MTTFLLVVLGIIFGIAFLAAIASTGFKILKGLFGFAYNLSKVVIAFALILLLFALLSLASK